MSWRYRRAKVLIVDDDDDARAELLHSATPHCDVVAVATRVEAEDELAGAPFDLVLADSALGRDVDGGRRLLAEVRRRWPEPRRVLMSARSQLTDDLFLWKPIASAALELLVDTCLATARARAEKRRAWARGGVAGAFISRLSRGSPPPALTRGRSPREARRTSASASQKMRRAGFRCALAPRLLSRSPSHDGSRRVETNQRAPRQGGCGDLMDHERREISMKRAIFAIVGLLALGACASKQEDKKEGAAAPADNTKKNERDRDDKTLTPGDQGGSEADRNLTAEIRKAVVGADGVSMDGKNVKIITKEGLVTLRGPVKTADEKTKIASIAQGIAGVKSVDNQLEIAN